MNAKAIIRKINTFKNCRDKKKFIRLKVINLCLAIKGVNFYGREDIEELQLDPLYSHGYQASNRWDLLEVLKKLNIKNDAIVDFGCGKGHALYIMSKFRFDHICGVEISPELYAIAINNFKKLKIKNIDLFLMDAANFADLDRYNMFYFFNPFPEIVMKQVVQNIIDSIKNNPRKATIVYMSPAYNDLIVSTNVFSIKGRHFFEQSTNRVTIYSNF